MGVGGSSAGGAVRAGLAFVELVANDNALVRALDNAQKRMKAFGSTMATVGAATAGAGAGILAPITALFGAAVNRASDLATLADEFGTTTEKLSALGYAFETAGVKQEEFADTLKGLSQKVSSAADGQDELFSRLGLNAQQLLRLPVDEQFNKIADALNKVPAAADRTNISLQLFGGAGSKLNRVLSQGSGELARLAGEASDVGAVMSGETAASGQKLMKTFTRLQAAVTNAFLAIGEALFPQADAIEEFAKAAMNVVRTVRGWIQQNKGLVLGAVAVGGALAVVGTVATGAGLVIAGLATAIGIAVAAFKLMVAVVTGTVAALASPLGIVAVAVAGLTYLFATQTETGRELAASISGELSDAWGTLRETAVGAWEGIGSALKRGDLQSAGEIALAGLNVAFQQGLFTLRTAWNGLQSYFVDGWTKSASTIGGVWETLVNRLAQLFIDLTQGILSRAAKVAGLLGNNPLAMALNATSADVGGLRSGIEDGARADAAERKRALEEELGARALARAADLGAAKEALAMAKERFAGMLDEERARAAEWQAAQTRAAKRGNDDRQSALAAATRGTFNASNSRGVFSAGNSVFQRQVTATNQVRDAVKEVKEAINAKEGGVFE